MVKAGSVGEHRKPSSAGGLVKIGFPLEDQWHGHAIEWMWAAPSRSSGLYMIMNSPFYAYGISW